MKKLLFIAIITLICNGLAFAQNDKREYPYEKIAKLRTQINKLLQKGDTKNALRVLDELKDEEIRKESEFYVIKAEVYFKAKDFENANEYFQTAFDFEMLEFFNQYNLCRDSYTGTNEDQVSCLSANLSYKKLAKINLKRQQEFITADVIQYLVPFNLKRSEELTPMFGDILYYRSWAFVKRNKYAEAVELLSLTIRCCPYIKAAFNLRAKAYRALGKNDLAEADEEKK